MWTLTDGVLYHGNGSESEEALHGSSWCLSGLPEGDLPLPRRLESKGDRSPSELKL